MLMEIIVFVADVISWDEDDEETTVTVWFEEDEDVLFVMIDRGTRLSL